MVVVGKLCKWEEVVPVILSFPNEDAYVLLQFLVNPSGLPIGLQMIGS